jgi:hypothetical protein
MNGATIVNLLSSNISAKSMFSGFLTPDKSIVLNNFPAIVIINTDESTGSGEHWCVAFHKNKNICEYFDPFGFSPNNEISGYNLTPNLFNNCKRILFNKKQIQSENASTCGHHCVYFSLLRSNNIPMKKILQHYYSNNPQDNDTAVIKFIDNLKNV